MDGNISGIIIVVVLALLALAGMLLYRQKGKASIKVGDVEMSFEGENPERRMAVARDPAEHDAPAPAHNARAGDAPGGVSIKDARAGGGILAEDSTGGGVKMKRVEAGDDILTTNWRFGSLLQGV